MTPFYLYELEVEVKVIAREGAGNGSVMGACGLFFF
jgi:hypothetical protein